MARKIFDSKELVEHIKHEPIVVYGAGFIATFFYNLLLAMGIASQVKMFVVSGNGGGNIKDVNIVSIRDYNNISNYLVCIAVHESVLPEIEKELYNMGIVDYVWVYPFLYDMWLGKPYKRSQPIRVKDIWNTMLDKYAVAVRYLAIEQYFGKNSIGNKLYKKAVILPKSPETADKRLASFYNLINSVNTRGFDASNSVKIWNDLRIIDGCHRFTIAMYLNQKEIPCDVYDLKNKLDVDYIPEEKRLYKNNLIKNGFTDEEICILEEIICRIDDTLKYSS